MLKDCQAMVTNKINYAYSTNVFEFIVQQSDEIKVVITELMNLLNDAAHA